MLINLIAVLTYVFIAWLLSVRLKRADVIDAFWGPGFVVVAVSTYLQRTTAVLEVFRIALLAMVVIWALRLGIHLLTRWWGESEEDRRYASMRKSGGDHWWLRSLVTVFLLQGIILWAVAFPLQMSLNKTTVVKLPLFVVGAVLWAIGFYFEAVGDYQLRAFRAQPDTSDRVLNSGLWRYTRHPNYFGDFAVWWGYFAMSVALGAPAWTVIGPMIMSVFLMKFSGVGMLERDISSRRPKYAEYVETTNAFFPWSPKTKS